MTRFIFITGGVVSSLGKGIASASIGALLQAIGYSVRIRKIDPYLNVDPGTMSPHQHGEVFVTDDGAESDLDLGHYERFTGNHSTKNDTITMGRVLSQVLQKERRGDYLGSTIQVIPHVTDHIQSLIMMGVDDVDFVICEIGGTVGDIEGLPVLEAVRQFCNLYSHNTPSTLLIHVTLVPYIAAAQELKTKPTQHSVKELLGLGLQPGILLCRSDRPIDADVLSKISSFCNVQPRRVIPLVDESTIYAVPLALMQNQLPQEICAHFKINPKKSPDLQPWRTYVQRVVRPSNAITSGTSVRLAVVGKYMNTRDAHKSINEAFIHAAAYHDVHLSIDWIESETLEDMSISGAANALGGYDGILIPGGFGKRGTHGMIMALQIARTHKIPCFGICFGMQLMVIEYARNVADMRDAMSTELDVEGDPIIALLQEWTDADGSKNTRSENDDMGGSMRLGRYPCHLRVGTKVHAIYGKDVVHERHRHRYEVNLKYKDALEKAGLIFSGASDDGVLTEIVEYDQHPWFVGVQFHPEFLSNPFHPHPLFAGFVKAAADQALKRT